MTRPSPFLRCAEAFDARPGFAEVTELLRAITERMDAVDDYRCVEAWEDGPPRINEVPEGWPLPLGRIHYRPEPQEPASGRDEVGSKETPANAPTRCTGTGSGFTNNVLMPEEWR